MKAILLSIKPEWLAKILNGEKTIEIRKKFPKDYVGWVFMYCSKGGDYLHKNCADIWWLEDKEFKRKRKKLGLVAAEIFNGKVVARFWCDKVDRYINGCNVAKKYPTFNDFEKILAPACIYTDELENYCEDLSFFAIHISKLEIFDEPKELSEFKHCTEKTCIYGKCHKYMHCLKPLTKAPQNYCYVEVE